MEFTCLLDNVQDVRNAFISAVGSYTEIDLLGGRIGLESSLTHESILTCLKRSRDAKNGVRRRSLHVLKSGHPGGFS